MARLRTATIGLAVLFALAILPIYGKKIASKRDYADFDVYHRTAQRIQAAQWDLVYNFEVDGNCPYRYAPPSLPIFAPFARMELPSARLLWFFIQFGLYVAAFGMLWRALRRIGGGADATWITAATFLFVLRFCLDSFTIGQVSGLMLLLFCLSVDAWVARRPGVAAVALLPPAILKVGPGFLYGLFATGGRGFALLGAGWSILALAGMTVAVGAWLGDWEKYRFLWERWFHVLRSAEVFFDSAHYGSQSFKSALLRTFAGLGWGRSAADGLHLAVSLLGCGAILTFWAVRTPKTDRARGLFYGLGLLAYLWFMPETFKYSLPFLSIPVAFWLAGSMARVDWAVFGFGVAMLSLAGLDVIGPTLFFGMQKLSLPFVAMALIGWRVVEHARRESALRPWAAAMGGKLVARKSKGR